MDRTLQTPDERLNDLVTEVAELTGEDYVTAMCEALQERRDRLISHGGKGRTPRIIRLTLEAEIPEEVLRKGDSGR